MSKSGKVAPRYHPGYLCNDGSGREIWTLVSEDNGSFLRDHGSVLFFSSAEEAQEYGDEQGCMVRPVRETGS